MRERSGPGHTVYKHRDDGSIVQVRWADPSWTTTFLSANDARHPEAVAQALRRAYFDGFEDRAVMIRNALGASADV